MESCQLAADCYSAVAAVDRRAAQAIELANGMILFLQEDHELPLISGQATAAAEVRDRSARTRLGILDVYHEWRTGGTTR